jgi:hypothetical protein
MLQLTAPVQVPNINRIKCEAARFDDEAGVFECRLRILGVGGIEYRLLVAGGAVLRVRNGTCEGLAVNAGATTYDGMVRPAEVQLPTGYTDLLAAYHASGNTNAAKLRNVEAWATSVGLLPAGTVS